MKILFVGPIDKGQTSGMRMDILRELGHEVVGLNSQSGWDSASMISRRLQQTIAEGPVVRKINSDLLASAEKNRPQWLWAEKQEYLFPDTLKKIAGMGIKSLHFTPDPYFSLAWKRTRLSNGCLPLYEHAVTSKKYELDEYRRKCKNVIYMPLGYSEAVHRPLFPADGTSREKYASDVTFIGGWEPRRERMLEAVAKTGCRLKIWGYGWDFLGDGKWTLRRWLSMRRNAAAAPFNIKKNEALANAVQGGEVYADAYAMAVSGARINVGFLRRVCPDQHTTRTFEVPACGSLLLADRTDEHRQLFEEGREADFFSCSAELTDKVKFYLAHEDTRKKVAAAGREKCKSAGYSYKNRLVSVLDRIGAQ